MKKVALAFAISVFFASFAMGAGCDPTTKSCIYAGGTQGYNKKCGSSNSIDDVLCRLSEASKWHTTSKSKR